MRPFALNLTAALAYAAGANFMKYSDGLRRVVPALLLYTCFAVGATLQAFALQHQEVGVSNTIVLGVEAIAAVALSAIFFREAVTFSKVIAIGLVSLGIYVIRK
jgi:quaternary ammonium compound-resistance protein SugE